MGQISIRKRNALESLVRFSMCFERVEPFFYNFDWKLCLIFVYYKHVTSDWSWHSYMILHLQSNCNSTWIAPTKSIGDPKEYIGQTCSWVQIYFSFCPSSLEIVHLYSLVQHLQCVHVEMYWDLYSKCLKLVLSCI